MLGWSSLQILSEVYSSYLLSPSAPFLSSLTFTMIKALILLGEAELVASGALCSWCLYLP